MTSLGFERCCDEIVTQTDLLRSHVKNADMTAPVPTCPGWNLGRLLRHLGGHHRWAETVVRTRATEPVPDDVLNDVSAYTDEDAAVLDSWLAEGAERLAETLREAGPDVRVWSPADEQATDRSPRFWARRTTHETVVHRADAALAVGADYAVAEEVARDGLEEWLHFSTVPEAYEGVPGLLGPGHTLHFHADGAAGEWLVDLTGEAPSWRHAHEKAAVAARGPITDLLLYVYNRPAPGIELIGDTALLELWRQSAGFWLEA
ncbi:maleylpyruvate isomerase family mycothiol-dependent enzyme [Nonomuraea sp. MTCD27]|uniref:maleylpyruvate isomerase family mycothiol-dependent enzyme n=1 Tax=Nonomuraea sp. MTCD27 TaxID=1676747 RepID=UPI0035C10583